MTPHSCESSHSSYRPLYVEGHANVIGTLAYVFEGGINTHTLEPTPTQGKVMMTSERPL